MKTCPECGVALPKREAGRKGRAASFCSKEHQQAFQHRQAVQGRAVIAMAKAWRASRNRKEDRETGSKALTELCAILDQFNAEDRQAGRASPVAYADDLLKQGRFIDRMKGR